MHVFVERFTVKPGTAERVEAAGRKFIEDTRKEAGCLNAGLYRDTMAENGYIFVEEWESRDHFNAHMAAALESEFAKVSGECSESSPTIFLHEVANSEKLM